MVVGILRIKLHVGNSRSLKEKRAVVRSLIARINAQFRVSVAEVGELDRWQTAEVGVVCVSNERCVADRMLAHIIDFAVANAGEGVVTDVQTEILTVN
jgi:uncharacterized protein YlxP (DUF503 family)